MVPKLRFPGFEGVWNKKTLGDIGKVKMCKRVFNNQTAPDEEIPFFKIGTFGKAPDAYISRSLFKSLKTRFSYPNKGDILISASGTLGRTVVYDGMEAYYQDSNIVWLENDQKLVPNEFLYYLYQIVKYDAEGSTIKRLYNSIILKTIISVPKIEEQQKIASFLSSVDEKISQLEKKKTLLETYKSGIMQKIFSQELRFKDENGQEFPKWKYLPLGKMTNIKSSKRVLKDDWKNEGIPFYRTREIISLSNKESFNTPTFIDEKLYEELKINYGVPTVNDILVTGVGTIGITYLVEDNKPFYFKDGNVILVESSDSLDSQFIKYCYQTRHVKKQLSDNASITTVATYTIDNARKTIIPVPLITEQQKIASFLSSIDKKIEITSTQLEKTREFKKGLLQQMFV